ncbi:hypothetical protein E2C01_074825 [Portunus trituberculatus]|uniref:Uncharacterized protein n=1 Tax=Portunus trituberculatus TaxID=210409 RepID=A0A5B7I4G7_PORTR|nr:hypothetical protein [Portunus trituberculatus]
MPGVRRSKPRKEAEGGEAGGDLCLATGEIFLDFETKVMEVCDPRQAENGARYGLGCGGRDGAGRSVSLGRQEANLD